MIVSEIIDLVGINKCRCHGDVVLLISNVCLLGCVIINDKYNGVLYMYVYVCILERERIEGLREGDRERLIGSVEREGEKNEKERGRYVAK